MARRCPNAIDQYSQKASEIIPKLHRIIPSQYNVYMYYIV